MRNTVEICGRRVTVELTAPAAEALQRRSTPLLAEMELYFSCLLRKKVRFRDPVGEPGQVSVGDGLTIAFRPVMTRGCSVAEVAGEPPITDFPIANPSAFVPRWLRIDYRAGCWEGEFGYR